MNKISKHTALEHYKWGNNCDGWNFVDEPSLSVKQELMPANTFEQLHFHKHSQQFFFILKGEASFELEGETVQLKEGDGIHIKAGMKHRIKNPSNHDLEFILCSQPSTLNDRFNCELI